jgi:hypothetical protein
MPDGERGRTEPSVRLGWPAAEDNEVFAPLVADDPREIGGYVLRARIGEGGWARSISPTPVEGERWR